MNKTVTINLASILFHIDEEAYNKLKEYLDAIKNSLANEEGKEEIITDIEARIAEIFNEKKQFEQQVISASEVEEVIKIMGQPEDYSVDETPEFENEPPQKSTSTIKKLFRDPLDTYIGGVSSGLGHYFGLDPIWMRIIWVLLVLGSSGVFIFVYLGFWFFVPKANSTAEQLAMKGQPITINTIEQKVKEEFEKADIKSITTTYFEYSREIFFFSLKIIVKLFGIYLIISAGSVLFFSILGLLGISIFNVLDPYWLQYINAFNIGFPLWVVSLLAFLIIAIPAFFVLLLGLKILVKKLKPIGKITSLVLIGIWIISILCLLFSGIKQYTERSFNGTVSINEIVNTSPKDTLHIYMNESNTYDTDNLPAPFDAFTLKNNNYDFDYAYKPFKIYENKDQKILLFDDINFFVKTTTDNKVVLKINKKAKGSSLEKAKQRAGAIDFKYTIKENSIYIDPYALVKYSDKYADQKVELILFVPNKSALFIDANAEQITRNKYKGSFLPIKGKEGHYLKIEDHKLLCTSCPPKEDWEDDSWDYNNEAETKAINMNFEDGQDKFNMKIDKNGINIEAKSDKKNRNRF